MSASPTSPDPEIQQLVEKGYAITLLDGSLIVSQVPYVPERGRVARGELIVPLAMRGGSICAPQRHLARWIGNRPCEVDGSALAAVNVSHGGAHPRYPGATVLSLCSRPRGREFRDHVEFVETYIALLGAPAFDIDPTATARVHRGMRSIDTAGGVFTYRDTATARAGLETFAARVQGHSVGIVGLGGTGSYVLDLLCKCALGAIHLFDDDRFEQHSAFRAPGAATIDDLRANRLKVEHFATKYAAIHRRIVPHAIRIDGRTAPVLDVLDFAFVCIDDAAARRPILARLAARGIAYVDVGMGLHASDRGIAGAVRTTLVASGGGAMVDRIPTTGDAGDLYATNIQICELNALNAALAVIAWKRHCGFYAASREQGNTVFVVEGGRLHIE